MNPFSVLAAFAADWHRLSGLLDGETRRELRALLTELRALESPSEGREATAASAVRTVLDALPPDEVERFREEGGRFSGDWPSGIAPSGYSTADLSLLVVDLNPMVGPLLGRVRDRLLREPTLTRGELVENGGDAADHRLIRLSDTEGAARFPSFQFEAASMPWPVVLEVNALLGADSDPWGVADWWLSEDAWLGQVPARLLGRGHDEELRGVALALSAASDEGS